MHRALPTTRRRAVPAAVVCALLLTACGSGGSTTGGSGLPTFSASTGTSTTAAPSASTSTSAEPEPDPSPWTALPTISEGPNKGVHQGSVLASSVAKTLDEEAAVEAFMAYWSYLGEAAAEPAVNKAALDKVAMGAAADDIRAYVRKLKKQGRRTIGWDSSHVTKIALGKSGAILNVCVDNGTFDVDASTGKKLEDPVQAYELLIGVRNSPSWKVSTARTTSRDEAC